MREAANDHGRQDFRVDDVIPVSDKKLTPEEYEICKLKVGVRSRQNGMLRQMVGRDIFANAGHSDMQERPVNLSITGISFVSCNRYEKGDALQVNIMLPSFPPSILDLVGEIVRVSAVDEKRQQIGVQFYYRCDDEEETVAKYVYRRHRETIRAENKNSRD